MGFFLVELHRSGAEWDASRPMEEQSHWPAHASFMDHLVRAGVVVLGGPLADDYRVVLVMNAESEDTVHTILGQDPWSGTHLRLTRIEGWTIRLDSRRV